jgi:hypothetical protein
MKHDVNPISLISNGGGSRCVEADGLGIGGGSSDINGGGSGGIVRTLIALAVLALAGCQSLDHAGYDSYTVRSFKSELGMAACCELEVKSGKEYDGRAVSFQTNGSGAVLQIQEGQSKAFKGQGIAAKAASVLPVTGLQDLVK